MTGFHDGNAAQNGYGFRRIQADGEFLLVIRFGKFRIRGLDAPFLSGFLPARAVPAVRIHACGEIHADGGVLHFPPARHQVSAAEHDGQQKRDDDNFERFNIHGGGNA